MGHEQGHLHTLTLTLAICNIVGAQHAQLLKIVERMPGSRACDERVAMRFRRFLKHDEMSLEH